MESEQIEKISSGACGAQRCQAATTEAARLHGNEAKKYDADPTRWVVSVKPVAMPKLPPPPPRHAQKRSGLRRASHSSTRPSAVTIVRATTLSQVVPSAREARPTPPPSARPPTPTVGQEPAGTVRPRRASAE